MWLSFIKNLNKFKQYINCIDDVPKYMAMRNREIQLDIITPQVAKQIDGLIRYWNICDDELGLSIGAREPIKIYINSIGGQLDAAITIMNSIKISRTPVYTYNIGNTYKESFLIFLAGHRRYCYENALFMYSFTLDNSNANNESMFYTKTAAIDNLNANLKTFFLEKVSITENQYDKYIENELWFCAEDALRIHIVNEICKSH